jgi:hypothetical protein
MWKVCDVLAKAFAWFWVFNFVLCIPSLHLVEVLTFSVSSTILKEISIYTISTEIALNFILFWFLFFVFTVSYTSWSYKNAVLFRKYVCLSLGFVVPVNIVLSCLVLGGGPGVILPFFLGRGFFSAVSIFYSHSETVQNEFQAKFHTPNHSSIAPEPLPSENPIENPIALKADPSVKDILHQLVDQVYNIKNKLTDEEFLNLSQGLQQCYNKV